MTFESKAMKLQVFFENIRYLKVIKQQIQKSFTDCECSFKKDSKQLYSSWIMRMNKIIQGLMEVNPFRYTFPLLKIICMLINTEVDGIICDLILKTRKISTLQL